VQVHIELGIAGARRAVERGDLVMVVDALRASSTIVAALAGGARHVRPVATVEECRGGVTAGKRGGAKQAGFDLGNSPAGLSGRSRPRHERDLYREQRHGGDPRVHNKYAIEDVITATVILQQMPNCQGRGPIEPVWTEDVEGAFMGSDAGENLTKLGLREDVAFCARQDVFDVVPVPARGVLVAYGQDPDAGIR
jgi:phosphosulfolactate phosphohydrolase-like enzyme